MSDVHTLLLEAGLLAALGAMIVVLILVLGTVARAVRPLLDAIADGRLTTDGRARYAELVARDEADVAALEQVTDAADAELAELERALRTGPCAHATARPHARFSSQGPRRRP